MKSSIELKVVFMAGTQIEDAIVEAKEKAALYDVAYITFDFNGLSFAVGRTADIQELLSEWLDRAIGEQKFFCSS